MSERVLIVDDDERILRTFARNLRLAGYQTLIARGGKKALEVYTRERPSITIADTRLHHIDGFSVLQTIRDRDPDAEVILTTSYDDKELVLAALRAGVSDFISKPIDQLELEAALRRAQERLRLKRELTTITRALQNSDARFQAAAEGSLDSFFILQSKRDHAGKIVDFTIEYANSRGAELLSLPESALIGARVSETFSRAHIRPFLQQYSDVIKNGKPVELEFPVEAERGTTVWIYQQIVPLADGVAISSRDITARKQAEQTILKTNERLEQQVTARTEELRNANQALLRRNRELALLNRAIQAFTSSLELDQVINNAVEEVRHLLGAIGHSIWLTDLDTGELVCHHSIGPKAEEVRGWRLQPGQGLAGWVAQTGKSALVQDTRLHERYFKGVEQQTGIQLLSVLTVPLSIKDRIIGVIQIVDTEANRFNPADLNLLEPLAASVAIAIENARLYSQARQA